MIREGGKGQGICEHEGNTKIMAAQTPSDELKSRFLYRLTPVVIGDSRGVGEL